MKHLKEFLKFDLESFLKSKIITVSELKENYVYENGERTDKVQGTTAVCVIKRDETQYQANKDKEEYECRTNEDEKFNVKIPVVLSADLYRRLPKNKAVRLVNVKKANVWGQFNNNLSVECDDIVLIEQKKVN